MLKLLFFSAPVISGVGKSPQGNTKKPQQTQHFFLFFFFLKKYIRRCDFNPLSKISMVGSEPPSWLSLHTECPLVAHV